MPEQCVDLVVIVSQAAVTQSTVDRYTAHWRGVIAGLPQQPETEEDFLAARDFAKAAPEEERRIKEALNSILQGSPEIAEIVRTLQELETSLRTARLRCSKAVEAETEYRKTQILDDRARLVRMRNAELFSGPLAAVNLPDPAERLRNAGKGKRTIETYGEAVHAEAETIIAERTALAALCRVNLDLINAANLPAVSAVAESLMQRPTAEVQTVIARRQAEAEAAEMKKQAAVQREPEKLAALKSEVQKLANLHHMSNWERKHKNDLAHPDDQAELWQFFGAHHARVESRNRPPHPADAHQAAPQVPPAQYQEPVRQPAAVQQPLPQPAAPEREREVTPTIKMELSRAEAEMVVDDNHVDWSPEEEEIVDTGRWTVTISAVKKHIPTGTYWNFCYRRPATENQCVEPFEGDSEPICPQRVKQIERVDSVWVDADYVDVVEIAQTTPPAAPRAAGRPEGMPETGFALEIQFHGGQLDEEGMRRLYGQVCDVVEAAGGEVFKARKI